MTLKTRLFLGFFLFAFLPVAVFSYVSLELAIGSLERIASPGLEEALLDARALTDAALNGYAEHCLALTPPPAAGGRARDYLDHGLDIALLIAGGDTTLAVAPTVAPTATPTVGSGVAPAVTPPEAPPGLRARLVGLPPPAGAAGSGWMVLEDRLLVYAQRTEAGRRIVTGCLLEGDPGRLLSELGFHLQRFGELKLMRTGGQRMLRVLWGAVNLIYLLGILLVSHLTARSLTRPLADLEREAARIGPGHWDVDVPATGSGEVGTLVTGFHRMSRRLAEATEQLVASERAAAWQQTARTIAHGIKNSLAPIKLALARLEAPAGEGQPVETLRSELERLEKIARDFSLYGRPMEVHPRATAVNPIVQQAVRLCAGLSGADRIDLDLAADLPPVRIDPYALREALINLIRNACEAVAGAGGGRETAREGTPPPAAPLWIRTTRAGEAVAITVGDRGPGLSETVRDRLFEPYVTTKPTGTGLGLPIVRKVVASLGGTIDVDTGSGGTIFRLCFPIGEGEHDPSHARQPSAGGADGKES